MQAALELGSPVTGIAESVFARSLSSTSRETRLEAQEVLAAGVPEPGTVDDAAFIEDVRRALYCSKLVAYAQGLEMLDAASAEHDWDLQLDVIASLWRAGCIIRAELLEDIMAAYKDKETAPRNLLFAPAFRDVIAEYLPSWRRVVVEATNRGIPAPVFASSLSYYDGLRRPRSNAALTQGLRDYFGAHTYLRTDSEGAFHTLWSSDRSEIDS